MNVNVYQQSFSLRDSFASLNSQPGWTSFDCDSTPKLLGTRSPRKLIACQSSFLPRVYISPAAGRLMYQYEGSIFTIPAQSTVCFPSNNSPWSNGRAAALYVNASLNMYSYIPDPKQPITTIPFTNGSVFQEDVTKPAVLCFGNPLQSAAVVNMTSLQSFRELAPQQFAVDDVNAYVLDLSKFRASPTTAVTIRVALGSTQPSYSLNYELVSNAQRPLSPSDFAMASTASFSTGVASISVPSTGDYRWIVFTLPTQTLIQRPVVSADIAQLFTPVSQSPDQIVVIGSSGITTYRIDLTTLRGKIVRLVQSCNPFSSSNLGPIDYYLIRTTTTSLDIPATVTLSSRHFSSVLLNGGSPLPQDVAILLFRSGLSSADFCTVNVFVEPQTSILNLGLVRPPTSLTLWFTGDWNGYNFTVTNANPVCFNSAGRFPNFDTQWNVGAFDVATGSASPLSLYEMAQDGVITKRDAWQGAVFSDSSKIMCLAAENACSSTPIRVSMLASGLAVPTDTYITGTTDGSAVVDVSNSSVATLVTP